MKREVWYLAHPVAGDVADNALRAHEWLRWLMESEPDVAFEASWLAAVDAGADDSDPQQRARGLADCREIAARCDGVVLVGGRVTRGMADELDAVAARGGWIADLTWLGPIAPAAPMQGVVERTRRRLHDPDTPVVDVVDWLARDAWKRTRSGGRG